MLIGSNSQSAIDKLKKDLSSKFVIKDLGKAKKVLGMKIERDRRSSKISLMRKRYLKKVLQKFNINSDMKYVSTPLAPYFKLKAPYFKLKATMSLITVEECEYTTHVPYASTVGI